MSETTLRLDLSIRCLTKVDKVSLISLTILNKYLGALISLLSCNNNYFQYRIHCSFFTKSYKFHKNVRVHACYLESDYYRSTHQRCSVKKVFLERTLELILGDSRNYMPPILVPSSAKRIATQILVITKLNQRKYFILRVFLCDTIRTSKKLPVQSSNLRARIRCESCLILTMSMFTIFNINDINGVVLLSLLLTVNIFQTLF